MYGIWTDFRKPQWEQYLEDAPLPVIEKTGLSREELKNILKILDEHRIIN